MEDTDKKLIIIGVDGRLLQGNLTGVGKYILNLIEYIALNDSNTEIRVYTNRKISCSFNASNIFIVEDKTIFFKIKPMIWSKFFSHRIINNDKIDIYLSGDTFVPLFLQSKKILSIVHDVAFIITPKTMSRLHLLISKVFFKRDLLKADALIANSKGTADKIKKYFNRQADVIVYPIIDKWFEVKNKAAINEKLLKLNIRWPYILSVATQEPRKNLDKTIKAFISVKRNGKLKDYKLLLIGSKGWKSKKIKGLISSYKNDILSLGYIKDSLLPYIYNGAALFVFPSQYEGFGMPAREAMLCGAKVVVTDISELREATYNNAFYVNNLDEESLGNAMVNAIMSGVAATKNFVDEYSDNQIQQLIPLIRKLAVHS